MSGDAPPPPGVIDEGQVYTLPEAQARLNMGETAFRSARLRKENGLVVHYSGNSAFVLGRDIITYIENCPTERAK